ncbi:MAG: hypothetical protein AAF213_11305 [Pseudomonadota bacterium]
MSKPDKYLVFLSFVGFAIVYAIVASGAIFHHYIPAYGPAVYDQYFLALWNGKVDVPPQVIRYEGHYAPDGTAYVYHGLAPLLTRAALAPFIQIGSVSLAAFSIWFWAVLGTGLYHLMIARWLSRQVDAETPSTLAVQIIFSLGIWLGGPGILLVSNTALYHEPIAVAYAMVAGFLWCALWPRGEGTYALLWRLFMMACFAAVTVHARPSVAVGLYAILCFLSLYHLRLDWRRALLPAAVVMVVLLVSGLAYIGFNAYRMGSGLTMHGSFEAGSIQYGSTFLGLEPVDSVRARSFEENGRFALARILPNLMVYLIDFQFSIITLFITTLHFHLVNAVSGYVRIEGPSIGLVFLWPVWMFLAWQARAHFQRHWSASNIILGGLLLVTVLTLSYATITLRYRFDIWPLIIAIALLGLRKSQARAPDKPIPPAQVTLYGILTAIGVFVSVATAVSYSHNFRYNVFSMEWTDHQCREIMGEIGFDASEHDHLCRRPEHYTF